MRIAAWTSRSASRARAFCSLRCPKRVRPSKRVQFKVAPTLQFQFLLLKLASLVRLYRPVALRDGRKPSIGILASERCDAAAQRSEPTSSRRARASPIRASASAASADAASIRNSGTTSDPRTASAESRRLPSWRVLVSTSPLTCVNPTSAVAYSSSARVTSLTEARPAAKRALAASRFCPAKAKRRADASRTWVVPRVARKAWLTSKASCLRLSSAAATSAFRWDRTAARLVMLRASNRVCERFNVSERALKRWMTTSELPTTRRVS